METDILGDLLKTINFNKNTRDISHQETLSFLKTLKDIKPNNLNITVNDILKPKAVNEIIKDIFESARNNFPVDKNSTPQPNSKNKPGLRVPLINTYNCRLYLAEKKLSIYDSLFDSTSSYKEALFSKYRNKIQLILVNIYRISMVYDVMKFINPRTTIEEAIFTVFTLTLNFSSDNSASSDIANFNFLNRLEDPPDWVFCKSFMDSFKLSFVLERGVQEEVRLYNKQYYDDSLYILFEFESTAAIYLKSITRL